MLTEPRSINVLGTDIKILFRKEADDPQLEEMGGYFDSSEKLIVVKIPEKEKTLSETLKTGREKCYGMKSSMRFCMSPVWIGLQILLNAGQPTKRWWTGLQFRSLRSARYTGIKSWCDLCTKTQLHCSTVNPEDPAVIRGIPL